MSDIEKAVQETLREMLPREIDKVKPDAALEDLLLDSVDMLEFKMRLEERLEADLEVEDFDASATLREFSAKLARSLGHGDAGH
jgi:acyl carrier protein